MSRFRWVPEPVRKLLRPLVNRYRQRRERNENLDILRSLDGRWSEQPDYEAYLLAQVTRSRRMQLHLASGRIAYLVRRLMEHDQRGSSNRSVLCVGCRNTHELHALEDAGFEQVIGIDLFRSDDAIVQMDMHRMTFPDKHFDVIFSCHSLEHAYDPAAVLQEFARVVRDDGVCVIEVPIRYKISATDLHDFGSLQGLQKACGFFTSRVLFAEESEDGKRARAIFVARSIPAAQKV
jgi:SAM-dependent methyltransferase